MPNGDFVRLLQGTRSNVASTAKQAGSLLFATYEDELQTTSGAKTVVQGDIYFDLNDSTRVNLANDVDKARTLFAGQTATTDTAGIWTAQIDGITELYDGLTIVLKLNTSYNSTYNSLNINDLGPKLVWYRRNSRLTSHIPQYAEALLVYRTNAGSYTVPSSSTRVDIPKNTTCTDGWVMVTVYQDGNTYPSAYCSTSATNPKKTATCSNYEATANTYIHLLLTATNTSQNALTLNINSKGAKPVYINSQASSSTNYDLPAGSYIAYYDGTNYYVRTDGLLPGPGISGSAAHATTADSLSTTGTILVDLESTTASTYTSGGDITPGISGVLPVTNGGTARNHLTSNATIVGNGGGQVKMITSADGAYYAIAANAEPQFGTLPVAQGGTGQTSLANIYKNWGFWSLTGGTAIGSGADLNSFTTVGNYYCNDGTIAKSVLHNIYSDTANNSMLPFTLKVYHGDGDSSTRLKQELSIYNSNYKWVRYSTNSGSVWSEWKNISTSPAGDTNSPVYIDASGIAQEITVLTPAHGGTGSTSVLSGNRVIYSHPTTKNMKEADSLYTSGADLAINKTSITSGYTLEVNGKTLLDDDLTMAANKKITVGTFTIGGNTDALSKTISSSSTIHLNRASNTSLIIQKNGVENARFDTSGHFIPGADNTYDIGSETKRWKNLYCMDGNFSGDVSCTGDLSVAGAADLLTTLSVHGASTFSGAVTINSTAQIKNILTLYRESTTTQNEPAGITFTNKDTTTGLSDSGAHIYAYNSHHTTNSIGLNMMIQAASSILIGAGEGVNSVRSSVMGTNPYTYEHVFLLADSNIYLEANTNSNSAADRLGICINTDGAVIPVKIESNNSNAQDIGTSTNYWKTVYSNAIAVNNIKALASGNTFYTQDSNGNQTIGFTTTKDSMAIYPYADNKGTLGSPHLRWNKIYVSSFAPDQEFDVVKTIGTSWIDSGISGTDINTGTNIIQIFDNTSTTGSLEHKNTYWSGIFSWYSGSVDENNKYSEIALHSCGEHIDDKVIYARVISSIPENASTGVMKLQIKSNVAPIQGTALKIKIKNIM